MKHNHCFFILMLLFGIAGFFAGCDNSPDVTGVEILPAGAILKVGEVKQFTAVISPSDAGNKAVTWKFNTMWEIDPLGDSVISIFSTGKAKAKAEGKVKVICISDDMHFEATAEIVVGYAAAVSGSYKGTLMQGDKTVEKENARPSLEHQSEYVATFSFIPFPYFPDRKKDTVYSCNVVVDYSGDTMNFMGESPVDMRGKTVIMKASGTVNMAGSSNFKIFMGDDPGMQFSFFGAKLLPILPTAN